MFYLRYCEPILILCILISVLVPASFAGNPIVFDDSKGLARLFEGIGAISGGGATSKLLVNYPEKQRDEILDYLFKPNFAASLQILKVEIGGDVQSTDGSEASHMHNRWDENYQRGYEWWLMQEAKKRNPDIKIYGLPWGFPGWLGKGSRNPYVDVNATADYVVRWINASESIYKVKVDFIGIWNERPYDITYIKTLRSMLDGRGFRHVRIIASDSTWKIAKDILKDPQLAKAIHAIGKHYPGTNSTVEAKMTGRALWASEDYSTVNTNIGGGCWARILNQNYVTGLMSSTIAWNLIVSYYPNLPWGMHGLMNASQPWSGNYQVASPIYVSAHTTQFVPIGWRYFKHGSGVGMLPKGGSYVAFSSTDMNDMTIVIETMSYNHSQCVRPYLAPYKVSSQDITIVLKGSFASISRMNVWYTKLGFNGKKTTLFEKQTPIFFTNGQATLRLGVDEVYTLTTVTTGNKGSYLAPPHPKPFPLPYSDDFESYKISQEPFHISPQLGYMEVVRGSSSKVLRQVVQEKPVSWCKVKANLPNKTMSIVGDYNWDDVFVEVDFEIDRHNGTNGTFVAARVDRSGCWYLFGTRGVFFFVTEGQYFVSTDLVRMEIIKQGPIASIAGRHTLSLLVKNGQAAGFMDKKKIFQVAIHNAPTNGWVAFGTDNFGLADFDNFRLLNATEGEAVARISKSGFF